MNDETNETKTENAAAETEVEAVPQNDDAQREASRPFLESIVDLGAEWAALGISFGVQALDRSARSLKLASKTLALVSRKLEESRRDMTAAATDAPADDQRAA